MTTLHTTSSLRPLDTDPPGQTELLMDRRPQLGSSAHSAVPVVVGVLVLVLGYVLLAVTWASVADETNVATQMPYLVSGGLTGLATVMSGLLILNIAVRRRDAASEALQLERLICEVVEIQTALREGEQR